MKVIKPEELNKNVFSMIGKEWLLVTAEKEGKVNTMTASWGGLGVMWGKDVAFIVLRPQRYTKEFVDAGETFSLSVLGGERRKTLNYLGTVSGRDEDKVAKSGLTVEREDGTPYFGRLIRCSSAASCMPSLTTLPALSTSPAMRDGIRIRIIIPCILRRLRRFWCAEKNAETADCRRSERRANTETLPAGRIDGET